MSREGGKRLRPITKERSRKLLLRLAASAIAGLLVLNSLEHTRWDWFGELERWMASAPRTAPTRPARRISPPAAPILVSPPAPQGIDSSLSTVAVPLILVRTQPGRNSREGFAQIGVNAKTPQTYAAGALLANGARVTEIFPRYVVLERDGKSVHLNLQGVGAAPSAADSALLTVGGPARSLAAIASSEERLTSYVRPSPVFVGNQLHGYALYPGGNSALFSRLGLEPGDVVIRINGAGVSDPTASLTQLRSLANGSVLTMEIEREGTTQTLSIDGSILNAATMSAIRATETTGTD
jgi:hypothetical protein